MVSEEKALSGTGYLEAEREERETGFYLYDRFLPSASGVPRDLQMPLTTAPMSLWLFASAAVVCFAVQAASISPILPT